MILILEHFDDGCPSQCGKLGSAPPAAGFCFELMMPISRGRGHQRPRITRKNRGTGALMQGGSRHLHLQAAFLPQLLNLLGE